MPVFLDCSDFALAESEVEDLWKATYTFMNASDEVVHVTCRSAEDMKSLNEKYRGKNSSTNVLTFRHQEGGDFPVPTEEKNHDVVICPDVARKEAEERMMTEKDYTALLLVHGFLHALGLDHESSSDDEQHMRMAEKQILDKTGFVSVYL